MSSVTEHKHDSSSACLLLNWLLVKPVTSSCSVRKQNKGLMIRDRGPGSNRIKASWRSEARPWVRPVASAIAGFATRARLPLLRGHRVLRGDKTAE